MRVMITGASGGLGRAVAVACARRGYSLFLTDLEEEGLLCLKEGLERRFNAAIMVKACDLTDCTSVDALLHEIDEKKIRFEMLLNIAGMDFEGSFLERERENIVRIVSLNDAATLRITHAILERRQVNKRFTAVFVSSLASMFPMPLKATYAASKRFLFDFATALRQELKSQNVDVMVLCPGGMVTNDAVIAAISAQGIWGELTANPLEVVARKMLDRALRGKSLYVPGALNKILSLLGKVIPRAWLAAAIYWQWSRAQKKWLISDGDSKIMEPIEKSSPSSLFSIVAK